MKVFIIDTFDKYRREGNEKSIHWVSGRPWCIREVEMEWGVPKIQEKVEYDVNPAIFHIYEKYEDALKYIHDMQSTNGGMK